MKTSFTIGSRGSKLALWQANWVKAQLNALRPDANVEIEIFKTSGDVMRHVPLAVIGGKGAFTKELEEALLAERIDIAVHSLKDLPTILPDGLTIAAITEREVPYDALVLRADASNHAATLQSLPAGAIVGTSSLRRQAQLRFQRPDVEIRDVRGNVDTRLRKLDEGQYDALLLAAAGLRRLGFAARINATVPPDVMLPAVGQGALGIETRAADADTCVLVALLNHAPTHAACAAERALLRALGGGCQVPIAAHATVKDGRLHLDGLVAGMDGKEIIRAAIEDHATQAAHAGEALAARLREQGAERLLAGQV
jgi:hydroxymethylbilane synthase